MSEEPINRPRFVPVDEHRVIYPEKFHAAPPAPPPAKRTSRAKARAPQAAAKPVIDYSISRTPELEAAFRATLIEAQRQGISGIGGCMNMWDTRTENNDYFIREGNLRLGSAEYKVTLYSLSRVPLPDERDGSFGQFRVQQGAVRIEDANGHKFEVYAPMKRGIAQLGDYQNWTMFNKTNGGRVIKRTIFEFLRNPAIDPATGLGTTPPEIPGGFSFGALALPRDKRNLQVVPPTPTAVPVELTAVDNSPPKKKASAKKKTPAKKKRIAKTPAKTVRKLVRRPTRRKAVRAAPKPKPRKPR